MQRRWFVLSDCPLAPSPPPPGASLTRGGRLGIAVGGPTSLFALPARNFLGKILPAHAAEAPNSLRLTFWRDAERLTWEPSACLGVSSRASPVVCWPPPRSKCSALLTEP